MGACQQQHPELDIKYASSIEDLSKGADALLVITDWPEFRSIDLAAIANLMNRPILVDGRNVFDPAEAAAAGFSYSGIGCGRTRSAEVPAALRATA